jgi:hypothetical protein
MSVASEEVAPRLILELAHILANRRLAEAEPHGSTCCSMHYFRDDTNAGYAG